MKNITAEHVRNLLDYDSETGIFTWKVSNSNRVKVGAVAGSDNGSGYIKITIKTVRFYAHRLAWFFVHGQWPAHEIDHKDGNRSNNRIANLRNSLHSENGQNQAKRVTNSSGKHGVSWSKLHEKWEAYIWVNGKKKYLGLYHQLEDAGLAYLAAKKKYHQFQPSPRDI